MRVVDVARDVQVGGAKRPPRALAVARRLGVAQAHGRAALARALRVEVDEAIAEPRRPPGLVDPHPERDGVDAPRVAGHGRAPLGREPPQAAAERAHRHRLAEARPRLDAQPQPAHDPHPALVEAGVEQVRVGDVLEPARDRVEAHPAVAHRVGDPGLQGRARRSVPPRAPGRARSAPRGPARVLVDLAGEVGVQRDREVVPHALDQPQLRPANRGGRRPSGRGADQRIGGSVDDERG